MACLVEIKSCPSGYRLGSATATGSCSTNTSGSSHLLVNATACATVVSVTDSNAFPHPRRGHPMSPHHDVSPALRLTTRCGRLCQCQCQPQRQLLAVLLTIALLVAGSCKAEVVTNKMQSES